MVTFISQCEKNSLKKTRRVLDAFANRIGDNTWQTVITEEGLNTVKKMLRQTASKSTAVSCHWIRSRSRSQFLWVVGNKSKFNQEGVVPVNYTERVVQLEESNWALLPLIQSLTALAGLFHDWGKSSICFQNKLKSKKTLADPLRHEWISCILLNHYIAGAKTDEEWLERLEKGEFSDSFGKGATFTEIEKPLANLPTIASLTCWLILSHHRLPLLGEKERSLFKKTPLEAYKNLFNFIQDNFGYANSTDLEKNECLTFPDGLPHLSVHWVKLIKRWASRVHSQVNLFKHSLENGTWRVVLHYSRLSLMGGDHYYSSLSASPKWKAKSTWPLFANTEKKNRKSVLSQKLDEHLVEVTQKALDLTHWLPGFENRMPEVEDSKALRIRSTDKNYLWQDKAVDAIKAWRKSIDTEKKIGFFAVNMASTGCGKTFANAKIMRALSDDQKSLRYILALGLRTLTLQTGDEYRERVKLKRNELGVLIGSNAILELHNLQKEGQTEDENIAEIGSESIENLMTETIDYECDVPDDNLDTVLKNEKARSFLYAPVLACTIDHLMGATETCRGGRHLLPSLRLMSSDLVIDEIDDFSGDDLIAIGRLIYLAGMLGRKVMISSATIPPDLAAGYFNAYQQGWRLFAISRNLNPVIGCAWIHESDKSAAMVKTIPLSENEETTAYFSKSHTKFISKRLNFLSKQPPRRKANIVDINEPYAEISLEESYFSTVRDEIIRKHHQFNTRVDPFQKNVSFGVVRVANIPPCVALSRFLMETKWPDNISVRVMPYHSRQVLLMRHAQEAFLDQVLKRKKPMEVFSHPVIEEQLKVTKTEHVIYILVATPVEEVGRDHDFDWAVLEPSSYRSMIQLAGRVLRHRRDKTVETPNIALLRYNLKGFLEKCNNQKPRVVFSRPGYEDSNNRLRSHDLGDLLDEDMLFTGVDAVPRISKNKTLSPTEKLIDLEHYVTQMLLMNPSAKGPESLEGWLSQCWWLTAFPQKMTPFRKGKPEIKLFLTPTDDRDEFIFSETDFKGNIVGVELKKHIIQLPGTVDESRLWFKRNYGELLRKKAEETGESLLDAALKFGEITIPEDKKGEKCFNYTPQFGMYPGEGN